MTRRSGIVLLTTLVMVCGAVGLAQEEDTSSPALRIGWAEFKKQYDRRELVVIDVRPAASFEMGHIPGARSIPLEEVEKRAAALKKEKKPIVLYCA
jgi:3-mercaptopyruvate sulfurtransferase SseA